MSRETKQLVVESEGVEVKTFSSHDTNREFIF